MKYSSYYHGISDLILLIVLAILLPFIFGLTLFWGILLFFISMFLIHIYSKGIYKVEINGKELRKIYLIGSKEEFYDLTDNRIHKVYFGFPARMGLPIMKIFFNSPYEIIKVTCSERDVLKYYYNYFQNRQIKCEIFPEYEKKQLK